MKLDKALEFCSNKHNGPSKVNECVNYMMLNCTKFFDDGGSEQIDRELKQLREDARSNGVKFCRYCNLALDGNSYCKECKK